MTTPNLMLLYVADVPHSATFYADLLARQPVEQSPNFAMFVLDNGMPLGLWAAHEVQPAPVAAAGGLSSASVSTTTRRWRQPMPTGRGAASPSCRRRSISTSAAPSPPPIRTAIACASSRRRRSEASWPPGSQSAPPRMCGGGAPRASCR